MPSAPGFVKSVTGGSKFIATFIIDDIQFHFSGNLDLPVEEFTCNEASLEYGDMEQLATRQNFDGEVGTEELQLTLSNGPKITGSFMFPINSASNISGSGMWSED
ncbi:uncharacterized protein F5Z01DRAFT_259407 [Emericellopsis atlantica]|uniref:Uncharacterized protein n=1 Tax=Emericellopsis atlantica TaxID=2614577 RepID=A0A9P7ZGY5_9HYPO|nr:uncharacterized protein F5Z01DRAFT_259407 [Emericellopsis atlantica]KAG9251963.1 hypothetical protein F5Z01DRAFT_259407 [Emericellopsis atlantica]